MNSAMKRVRQEEPKTEGLGGKECLARLLTEFNNVCKRSAKEGKMPVKDFQRDRRMLELVNEVEKLAWRGENWESCDKAERVMEESDVQDMGAVHR